MIGEVTGQKEQPRANSLQGPTIIRYTYTSVQYDVEIKSQVGTPGFNTVTGVKKMEIKGGSKP